MARPKNPHKRHMSLCPWCKHEEAALINELYVSKRLTEKDIVKEYGISRNTVYNHINEFDLRSLKNKDIEIDTLDRILEAQVNANEVRAADQVKAAEVRAKITGKLDKGSEPKPLTTFNTLNLLTGLNVDELKKLIGSIPADLPPED
jgi:DNA-binding Xre family transcriptional regulator